MPDKTPYRKKKEHKKDITPSKKYVYDNYVSSKFDPNNPNSQHSPVRIDDNDFKPIRIKHMQLGHLKHRKQQNVIL